MATAISIVTALLNESESFKDQRVRVSTQARAADVLWNVDEAFARSLLLKAWGMAEKLDEASKQSTEEAKKNARRQGGVTIIPSASSLRSEILAIAARRDATFGNFFIGKLAEVTEQEKSEDEGKGLVQYRDPTEPSVAIAKRLEVALKLLDGGDIKQATTFADPALGFATSPGMIFLCTLRQKDPRAADRIFARLLTRASVDPVADATTVALLSSYIFTPTYIVTATRNGRISNQFGDGTGNPHPSSELRSRFFGVAAELFLRPLPPPDQDRSIAGRGGTYFTIARLLPMFQAYAPNYVSALNAQLAILARDATDAVRNGEDTMLRVGLASERSERNALDEILEKVRNVSSAVERDALYVKAIREGATKNDGRIRQFADKIEDDNLRQRARAFADFVVIKNALRSKDITTALAIERDGYLESLPRVWALSEIARLLRKKDSHRAGELLDEAAVHAQRLAIGDPNRVYALSCVATAFFSIDRVRSWSLASDVVKAANEVPGFTTEGGKLSMRLRAKNAVSMISETEPSFDIANLLELLATDNLQLALSTANGLTGENSHAATSLALARSVINKHKPTSQK